MKKFLALAVCSLGLGVLGGAAGAAPAAKTTGKMTSVVCPACKKMGMAMPMTAMKTKVNTRAVKVNGKVMYCCQQCKMMTMTSKKTTGHKAPAKKM